MSDATDIAILSADLVHVASGVRVEFVSGYVVIAGHVAVESLANATELLGEQESACGR